ncbi:MAG: hypothetical protein G3M78_00725 [Candidatus Nitrohelix vancouverensis]|uniref:Lipoprotein n=1 Tax=Candidatus Nitrohelix vancouverensis TaxID=2705534 RepID=A0A7T0C006_9BACT|nr:MAG: hypothetical protein G3M78_00725 [Candidatus Nitrohelix vancouverensis]
MKPPRYRQLPLCLAAFLLTALSACAGLGTQSEPHNPYHLQKISDLQLCVVFGGFEDDWAGRASREKVESELHRRDLLTKNEWILVREHRIARGMSLCGLYASWGPEISRQESQLESEAMRRHYFHCTTCEPLTVWTRDQRVVGWELPGEPETYPRKIK